MSGWAKALKWLVIVVVVLVVLLLGGYIIFMSLVFDALEPSNQGMGATVGMQALLIFAQGWPGHLVPG
jgi:flagellar basal body-associated protein FliL